MGEFEDLPDPGTVAREASAALARWKRFVLESEPLFTDIAKKLPDLEPPSTITVSQEKVVEGNWLSGKRTRVIAVTKRGWEIGYIEPNADYPTKAYLLSDGSVYPTTEAGIQALFARELGRPGPASVENPTAALKARALLIERLKRQYLERWCRGV